MTDALADNGAADVLVLPEGQGRLGSDSLTLPGGASADVFVDEDGDTIVQVGAGLVTAAELVRAVLRAPRFTPIGEILDVVVVCGQGYDRYVLSGDLGHRFLFTRQWQRREDRGDPVVAVVGHSPFQTETSTTEDSTRKLLESTLQLMHGEVGAPSKLHVVNVFTRRVSENHEITGAPDDRRQDPGFVAEALESADAVLASWGVVPEKGLWAVEETVEQLREVRDRGARILLRSFAGVIETSGQPPQPTGHRVVKQGTRLVDAPSDWLWGAPLD